jgi:predicted nucleic acid-binding protein
MCVKLASAKRDLSRFEILPLTEEIVEVSSRIHARLEQKGQTIGINDVYLASTTLHFKLKIVTQNSEHYQHIPGLEIET